MEALLGLMRCCPERLDGSMDLDQVAADRLTAFYQAFPKEEAFLTYFRKTWGHRIGEVKCLRIRLRMSGVAC